MYCRNVQYISSPNIEMPEYVKDMDFKQLVVDHPRLRSVNLEWRLPCQCPIEPDRLELAVHEGVIYMPSYMRRIYLPFGRPVELDTASEVISDQGDDWRPDDELCLPCCRSVEKVVDILLYKTKDWYDLDGVPSELDLHGLDLSKISVIRISDHRIADLEAYLEKVERSVDVGMHHLILKDLRPWRFPVLNTVIIGLAYLADLKHFQSVKSLRHLDVVFPSWCTTSPSEAPHVVLKYLATGGYLPRLRKATLWLCFSPASVTDEEIINLRELLRRNLPSLSTIKLHLRVLKRNIAASDKALAAYLIKVFGSTYNLDGIELTCHVGVYEPDGPKSVSVLNREAKLNGAIKRGQADWRRKRIEDHENGEKGWRVVEEVDGGEQEVLGEE